MFSRPGDWPLPDDFREVGMYLDTLTYLLRGILTKVDRARMAVGLEERMLLLDHRLTEFAWQLSFDMKHQSGQIWVLRHVLEHHVPRRLFVRPREDRGAA